MANGQIGATTPAELADRIQYWLEHLPRDRYASAPAEGTPARYGAVGLPGTFPIGGGAPSANSILNELSAHTPVRKQLSGLAASGLGVGEQYETEQTWEVESQNWMRPRPPADARYLLAQVAAAPNLIGAIDIAFLIGIPAIQLKQMLGMRWKTATLPRLGPSGNPDVVVLDRDPETGGLIEEWNSEVGQYAWEHSAAGESGLAFATEPLVVWGSGESASLRGWSGLAEAAATTYGLWTEAEKHADLSRLDRGLEAPDSWEVEDRQADEEEQEAASRQVTAQQTGRAVTAAARNRDSTATESPDVPVTTTTTLDEDGNPQTVTNDRCGGYGSEWYYDPASQTCRNSNDPTEQRTPAPVGQGEYDLEQGMNVLLGNVDQGYIAIRYFILPETATDLAERIPRSLFTDERIRDAGAPEDATGRNPTVAALMTDPSTRWEGYITRGGRRANLMSMKVAPGYTGYDPWAQMQAMDPTMLGLIQRQMVRAGLLAPGEYTETVPNEMTAIAFQSLMGLGNQNGTTWEEELATAIRMGDRARLEAWNNRTTRALPDIDAAALALEVESAVAGYLGRMPQRSERRALLAMLQDLEETAFEQEQRRAEVEAEMAYAEAYSPLAEMFPSIAKEPSMQRAMSHEGLPPVINATNSFRERFSRMYEGEIEHQEEQSKNPSEISSIERSVELIRNLIGGAGA